MEFFLSSPVPAVAAVAGLFIGRFLNVCIERLPREERFWRSLRSPFERPRACEGCRAIRPLWQFVPIVGSLLSAGRCPHCRRRLPRRYALIEILTAGLFVALYYFEVFTETGLAGPQFSLRCIYHIVLICALVVATFIDFDLRIIPDSATLPTMAVGLLGAWLLPDVALAPVWNQGVFPLLQNAGAEWPWPLSSLTQIRREPEWIVAFPHWHGLAVSVAGLLVGGGLVWAVRLIGHRTLQREAMGFGDVVLLAMIGSFLGWQPAVLIFFFAPFCALVSVIFVWIFWRDREIPFGPYLSLATLLVLFGWDVIWPRTEQIFALGILLPILLLVMLSGLALLLMLTRGIQRMLGFEPEPEMIEEWTSAEQLTYLACEVTEPDQGQWPRERWAGCDSGQGNLYRRQWRYGR